MAWQGVVTNQGAALLAQYATGEHTLTIDGATVGSGITETANLRIATALAHQEDTASILSKDAITDGTVYNVQVHACTAGRYQAHEVGLWAHLDSGQSVLLALHQDADGGIDVPQASVNPNFSFLLRISIVISNDGTVEVNVDTTAFITNGYLEDRLGLVREEMDEGLETLEGEITALDNAKAPLASPALTGTPTAPTAAAGTKTTQIATTAFVTQADEAMQEQVTALGNMDTAIEQGIAILATGNTHAAITSGQYVFVRNHSTLANGLYKASANIAANAALSTSNLVADSSGGLNSLKAGLDTLNSKINTKPTMAVNSWGSTISWTANGATSLLMISNVVLVLVWTPSSTAISVLVASEYGTYRKADETAGVLLFGKESTDTNYQITRSGNDLTLTLPKNESVKIIT